MSKLKIITVDDNGEIKTALDTLRRDTDPIFDHKQCMGETDALIAIVELDPNLCIIYDEDGSGNALNILVGIREAGLHPTVIVCIKGENLALEADYLKNGAMGVHAMSESLSLFLRFSLQVAHANLRSSERFRDDKNEIVARMYEMQDARDRAEEQGAELVDMAEGLAVAKGQLEILNREKTRFFSIIAHDLKSPFNSLLGYTHLLAHQKGELSPDKVREFAYNIDDSGKRVFALLENLLSWAQTQLDKTDIAAKQVKIVEITNRAIDALVAVAKDIDVKVRHQLSNEICYVDPNMIETVIRNLINNAIKFTNEGGDILIFTELIVEANNKFYEVSVRDSGVGISSERIARLFDFSDTLTTKGTAGENGTGLGLMLCKELVERNGGKIRVASSLGEGSTFSFSIPAM